ncbi:putative BPI/LBP family protein At1g04970 [Vicia villosa]|uniref:putative BPI/LBP family protein At1g04970 n=1 Tax=Vicia villosa TaxID=3911 RepID=UPI00273BC165|nr:putative BPI/LBP family protein At1g04970 [Vicia villosa]
MSHRISVLFLSFLLISTTSVSLEDGFISVIISDQGLDFVKDILINQSIASIVVSQLPQIEKSVQVPLVGKAHVILSEIMIKNIQVSSSSVETGDSGIAVVVSGATANLSLNWRYTVSSWLVPIGISDSGTATVKVEDMQVGLTVNLRNQGGTLKLDLLDYGCDVGELRIKMNGGAAWLYQVLVDAFKGNIGSAVEDAVSKKIREGIPTLDDLLQTLPKTISLDKTAALNVSFIDNPVLSNSSIELKINGLFSERKGVLVPQGYHKGSDPISLSNGDLPKMINISIHENVFKSASEVYFAADALHWILDELPNQSLLNTAEWKLIIPQLYKQYPNDDMNLNISVSSSPVIEVSDQDIDATVSIDLIIDVLEAGEIIPVTCISVNISASFDAEIVRKSLTGRLKLKKFSTYLKWSKIGKLHMNVIQSLTSTVLKTVLIPYLNSQLKKGIPLPILKGFALKNARIMNTPPWIVLSSDVTFLGDYYLRHHLASVS